jgi:mercuric ion binding protein
MKRFIIIILCVASLGFAAYAQTKDNAPKKEGIELLKIKTSAVCDMCKETIEKAMAYEKGVKESNLDVDSKVLTVRYDPRKTNPDKIRKAVTAAGYDADALPAEKRAYDNLNACCKKDYKH